MAKRSRHEQPLADVEVERMPDLDGWELYKAVDEAEARERWTVALHAGPSERAIQFALWTDPKAEPVATGALDPKAEKATRWARAARLAEKALGKGALDDDARAEILTAIAERADPAYREYDDRLAFAIEPLDGSTDGDADAHDQAGEDEDA